MNLSELTVEAFGLHIKKVVKFTKGLNIIVGESEEGKSTLIRALYLLIENSPRGGEKLYQSWLTDKKLMIQLKDDTGNIVKRTKNKYYLNDNKPLKAFGTSVPKPIKELFNFKEINWQKQNDKHFILFNTGGAAARLLNNATGMSDQEVIIDAFKQSLSHSKSEIKRHKKNNDIHLQTIEKLKNIVRYKFKAECIYYINKEINELEIKSDRLETILVQLEFINEDKEKYKITKQYIKNLNKILKDYEEINLYTNYINKLTDLLNKLKNIKIIDSNILLKFTKSLHTIHSKILELTSLKEKTELLGNHLAQIKASQIMQEATRKSILIQQTEIDKIFNELGYCPLCNRKVEDGDTCCR